MATGNIIPKIIYVGDGRVTQFDFDFPAVDKSNIVVYVKRNASGEITKLNQMDFSFVIEPTLTTGGEIKFPAETSEQAILGVNDQLCITRETTGGNEYEFANQERLFPRSIQNADDTIALQVLDLRAKIDRFLSADVFDTRSPDERYKELVEAVEEVSRNIVDVRTIRTDLNNEISARSSADSAEASARISGDNARITKTNLPTAVKSVSGSFSTSSVGLTVQSQDTSTGATSSSQIALPVATASQHGVMPKETYATVVQLVNRVDALEGSAQIYGVHLGTGTPTQQQYQEAWEQASGSAPGSTPQNGTRLLNLDSGKTIIYFANLAPNAWVDTGASTTPIATTDAVGVVKSTEDVDGKVTVETDGTMSLTGWDGVKSDITNLSGDVTSLSSSVSSLSSSLSTLDGEVVKKSGAQTIAGTKTFSDTIIAQRTFYCNDVRMDISSISDGLIIDCPGARIMDVRYSTSYPYGAVLFGSNTEVYLGEKATATTKASSDSSRAVATTEFIQRKLQKVDALPANPDSNVWYAITEP